MIERETVDKLIQHFGVANITDLSIRQLGKLVAQIESESGEEFVHMEMGVPGLPPSEIGVMAEQEALQRGLASRYPNIEGIPEVKEEIARFAHNFLDIRVSQRVCIPTVGAMQASFAAFLGVARSRADRPYTLFIDPGFPVQKSQLELLGVPYKSFDILHYRGGKKLSKKLEEMLQVGDICSIAYSSPNNPSWISLTKEELQVIGNLANQYDVVVIEDLAYFGMDFRCNYGTPSTPPYQPTVAQYTDNYILLLSASKIFSYAGQRIGMMILSETLFDRPFPNLTNYFPSENLGRFIPYGVLYATTAGTSHTAQYALSKMLKMANNGKYNFIDSLQEYGKKAKKMKEIFLRNGFYLVYDEPENRTLADGFYFTIAYPELNNAELMRYFLYIGISAISLSITGSENQAGIRACVSFVKLTQIETLQERLDKFKEIVKNRQNL